MKNTRFSSLCITLATLILNSCSTSPAYATAPLTLRYTIKAESPTPYNTTIYQGETVDLQATLTAYGSPFIIASNASVHLWYQTNGMGSGWWQGPATATTNGILTAHWTPALDVGASAYTFFVGVGDPPTNNLYRCFGTIRMGRSPGFVPNALAIPPQTLDFAAISYTNAPWATSADIDAAIAAILEDDPEATPIATNALAQAQAAHTAASNAQASASAAYTVGTNAVAIATTANTSATNALAQAQAAHTAATNAQATAGVALTTATNAVSLIEALPDNGSVWRSTIMGDSTNWLSIAEDMPFINRQAATADIRVVAVANGEMYFQTYNGPPVGTVWTSTGVDTWAATNGWILTRQAGDVWWIQGESMPPVSFMSPEASEPPTTLAGMDFGNGSVVLDWVYGPAPSRLLETPDISSFATTNWVKSIMGVYPDIATNLTYRIVVSNGNWLIYEN